MSITQQPDALNLEEFRAKVTHAAREPLLARIAELESQFEAIGAGGVEPLRKRASTADVVVADERDAFDKWLRIKPCGAAHDFGWQAWKARAALASTPVAAAPNAPLYDPREVAFSAQAAQPGWWDGVIKSSDFIVDTFRSGSRGWGPHPDNCVRIVHRPTGFFEEETAMRSVHANTAAAWQRLTDRLESLAKAPPPADAASMQMPEPAAWRDPTNLQPSQGCTYMRAIHEKWPHIYREPLYTEQQVRDLLAAQTCNKKGLCNEY